MYMNIESFLFYQVIKNFLMTPNDTLIEYKMIYLYIVGLD